MQKIKGAIRKERKERKRESEYAHDCTTAKAEKERGAK